MDYNFWENFYTQNKAVSHPSPFANFCQQKLLGANERILELGCGNGRDSFYFASQNHFVTAIDQSDEAQKRSNEICKKQSVKNLKFIAGNFADLKKEYIQENSVIYSRFSLHAINEREEDQLLDSIRVHALPNTKVIIETRTIYDDLFGVGEKLSPFEYKTDHYRRFIVPKNLIKKIIENNWEPFYVDLSKDLAPFGNENPIVLRLGFKV